jgi:hypothetical protein
MATIKKWLCFGLLRSVIWYKFTDVSDVLAASVIRPIIMDVANTSETSVNFFHTIWYSKLGTGILGLRNICAAEPVRVVSQILWRNKTPAP